MTTESNHSADLRTRMLDLAGEVAAARDKAARDAVALERSVTERMNLHQELGNAHRRNRVLEQQVLVLFGPAGAPDDHGVKLRAAIADARHVFEGQKVAEDVLHYLEQVLAAGASVPAQTVITPGSENASIANETHTPLGVAPTVVGADPFRAAARQAVMHQARADLAQAADAPARPTAAQQADIHRHQAAIDQAAAAMAAESTEKVADAERSAARTAIETSLDPLAILSREVFGLSNKFQQPADITVQLLVLAELRGIRSDVLRVPSLLHKVI
jgi:hypothetical protein